MFHVKHAQWFSESSGPDNSAEVIGTLQARIGALREASLLRATDGDERARAESRARALGVPFLDAASNDYLGLAERPIAEAFTSGLPGGAGASRLVHGTHPAHRDLERDLAAWLQAPDALLFASGYAANVGTVAALGVPGDTIVSDRLNHASIIDGCRLGEARVEVVDHLDLGAMGQALARPCPGQRWLVVEGLYSMDGHRPDLRKLRALTNEHGAALVVDESHSLGARGPEGRGECAAQGVAPDVLIAGLGKAFGMQGGVVAGDGALRTWLWNRARTFVYSTAPSPALAAATRARLAAVRDAEALRAQLETRSARLRARLSQHAQVHVVTGSEGPIVPILVGASLDALRIANAFLEQGVLVQAIRPPTVSDGTARIRLTVRATFTTHDIDRLAEVAVRACKS
jgi:8-amino-7-oxononanoate synthase